MHSDYHDNDHIRVCGNHPLYGAVLEAYRAQERHEEKRRGKRVAKYAPVVNVAAVVSARVQ